MSWETPTESFARPKAYASRDKWTQDLLGRFLCKPGDGSAPFFREIFQWDHVNYGKAVKAAEEALDRENLFNFGRFPAWSSKQDTSGSRKRASAESKLHNGNKGQLFQPAWLHDHAQRPKWYINGMVSADATDPTLQGHVNKDIHTVVQAFFTHVSTNRKRGIKKEDTEDQEEQLQASPSKKRSRSTSNISEASSTEGIRKKMTSMRPFAASSAESEDDVVMLDRPPAPPLPNLEDLILLVHRVTRSDKKLSGKLAMIKYTEILNTNRVVDWNEFREAAAVDESESIFWFRGVPIWKIEDVRELRSAIAWLRDNMDTTADRLSICLFKAKSEDDMRLVPDKQKRPYAGQEQSWSSTISQGVLDMDKEIAAGQQFEADHGHKFGQPSEPVRTPTPPEPPKDINEGSLQPTGKPTKHKKDRGEQSGTQVPLNPFPFMIRFDTHAERLKADEQLTEPTISTPAGFKMTLVEWLSSSNGVKSARVDVEKPGTEDQGGDGQDEKAEELQSAEDIVRQQIGSIRLTPEAWKSTCDFFRFDPTELDSRSMVYWEGWNRKFALKPYQFFTVAWTLRKIAAASPMTILALDMGLGKTCVGIACLFLLRVLQCRATKPGVMAPKNPFGPRVDNPEGAVEHESKEDSFDWVQLTGSRPEIYFGASLIICPPNLVANWVQEIRKATQSRYRPKIIVANSKLAWPKAERKTYEGCYQAQDYVQDDDLPHIKDMHHAWEPEYVQDLTQNGERITVCDLLSTDDDDERPRWLQDWWVIAPSSSVESSIATPMTPDHKREGMIDTIWSVVLVDEFHLTKKTTVRPFPTISSLRGNPPVIALSATPYRLTRDLAALTNASHAKYFDVLEGRATNKAKKTHVNSLGPHEFDLEHLRFKKGLTPAQRQAIRTSSWLDVDEDSKTVDHAMNPTALSQAGKDETNEDSAERRKVLEEAQPNLSRIAQWINPQMIQFDSDLVWQPDSAKPGMPAVEMPPHSAFDVRYDIGKKHESVLKPHWEQMLAGTNTNNQAKFLGLVERWRVLMLYPDLYDWTQNDATLKDELGSFTNDSMKKIFRDPTNSRLWTYMDRLHNSRAMRLLRHMLTEFRNQLNGRQHHRKAVFVAHKPFNIAVFAMYLRYLVDRDDYPALSSHEDIALIDSWGSTPKAVLRERIQAFVNVGDGENDYQEQPFVLCASASQINTGISLPPADVVVILDGNWNPAADTQLTGRVRRNRVVQKSKTTESYRLIPCSSYCHLPTWQAQRHSTQEAIKEHIKKASDPAEENTAQE